MAGSKLTELTDIGTSVTGDDLIYIVDAPGGTPAHKKITLSNLLGSLNIGIGFGSDSTYDIGSSTVRPSVVYSDIVDSPTVRGGSASGGDIQIDSTGHATPGLVRFGGGTVDYYDETSGLWHQTALAFQPRKPQPLVTFMFDDGLEDGFTVMFPLFVAQGEVATCAIVTDLIGTAGEMTWANLVTLQAAGWEMVSHSVTHVDLRALTEAQIRVELANSKAAMEAQGLTVTNFVYPYHYSNAAVRRLTREYYRSARGTYGANPSILDLYNLSCYQTDDPTKLATYQGYVDVAEAENRWLIFYMHLADAADAITIGALIDYIQAKSIPIVTVEQALNLIAPVIDNGEGFAVSDGGIRATFPDGAFFDDGYCIGPYFEWSSTFALLHGPAATTGYINFGNVTLWGWVEISVTSQYSIALAIGKLSRLFEIARDLGSPAVTQASVPLPSVGFTPDRFHIGNFEVASDVLRVPIQWVTGTELATVHVRGCLSGTSGSTQARAVLDGMSLTSPAGSDAASTVQRLPHLADPTDDATTLTAVATIIDGLKSLGYMAPDP